LYYGYIPFIETFSSILIAFIPILIPLFLIGISLKFYDYIKRALRFRKPKIDLKPVNIRVHAKPISNDYKVTWEEVEPYYEDSGKEFIDYEVLLNCPSCKSEIIDLDAFFCHQCGHQLKKPKVEWIDG